MQEKVGPGLDWKDIASQLMFGRFGVTERSQLSDAEWSDFAQRYVTAITQLAESMKEGDFPPPSEDEIKASFASNFEGVAVEVAVGSSDAASD
jgi:hypothetical protein